MASATQLAPPPYKITPCDNHAIDWSAAAIKAVAANIPPKFAERLDLEKIEICAQVRSLISLILPRMDRDGELYSPKKRHVYP